MNTPKHLHMLTIRMTRGERDGLKREAWQERISLNAHVRRRLRVSVWPVHSGVISAPAVPAA